MSLKLFSWILWPSLFTGNFKEFYFHSSLFAGGGLPLVSQTDPGDPPATHRVRTKRCSCNNQLDSECHYFCHLDIIWVNTPRWVFAHEWASPRYSYASKQQYKSSADAEDSLDRSPDWNGIMAEPSTFQELHRNAVKVLIHDLSSVGRRTRVKCWIYCFLSWNVLARVVILQALNSTKSRLCYIWCYTHSDKLINDSLGVFCTARLQFTDWEVHCLAGEGPLAAASAPTLLIGPAMLSVSTGEHYLSSASDVTYS